MKDFAVKNARRGSAPLSGLLLEAALLGALFSCAVQISGAQPSAESNPNFLRVDAHAHVFKSAPQFQAMLKRLNLRLLNICVVDKYERGYEEAAPQNAKAMQLLRQSQGDIAWCSTFDPQDWESPEFVQTTIAELDKTFDKGAIAVKIYKSIGMNLRSRTGKYLMPDDPVFNPVLDHIESRNKTLVAHVADESVSWRPLDPTSPYYDYFKRFPTWHMYRFPGSPSKAAVLDARDRMVARHPKLRVIGCHLGSMEEDVNEIAKRFERYPNFAVDLAAEMIGLMLQPREKVRDFVIKYQDRILYGTDAQFMPWDNIEKTIVNWESRYSQDWKFLATNELLPYRKGKIRGLGLPEPVLRKLYYENALKWLPGIMGSAKVN